MCSINSGYPGSCKTIFKIQLIARLRKIGCKISAIDEIKRLGKRLYGIMRHIPQEDRKKTSKNLSFDYALISFMILSVLRAKFSIYPDYGLFSMIFLKET